ncbi:MAG: aminodeoxychorismate/anthranilate synthase component II [Deltaproteobacteria bacterium]|nr:aminodeoxychorismate/anthranilate synthase component II [Deltaproteobacteria bacterium]
MILVIDNYDSFTFNLVQYLLELGAEVRVERNDALTAADALAAGAAGILISPGPADPDEAGISVELIREAAGRVPILGVCLGHQSIAAAHGGKVVRARRVMHGKVSEIHHQGVGVFRGLPDPFLATRYHSLLVEAASLPACLEVTARTVDGEEEEIMGLRHREHPVEGVQFHPESILSEQGHALLQNWLEGLAGEKA